MAFFTLRGLAGMEWNGMGWDGIWNYTMDSSFFCSTTFEVVKSSATYCIDIDTLHSNSFLTKRLP